MITSRVSHDPLSRCLDGPPSCARTCLARIRLHQSNAVVSSPLFGLSNTFRSCLGATILQNSHSFLKHGLLSPYSSFMPHGLLTRSVHWLPTCAQTNSVCPKSSFQTCHKYQSYLQWTSVTRYIQSLLFVLATDVFYFLWVPGIPFPSASSFSKFLALLPCPGIKSFHKFSRQWTRTASILTRFLCAFCTGNTIDLFRPNAS